ncbi:hypothetical protein Trydic_g23783 [Trypoxylus dichotomus]
MGTQTVRDRLSQNGIRVVVLLFLPEITEWLISDESRFSPYTSDTRTPVYRRDVLDWPAVSSAMNPIENM